MLKAELFRLVKSKTMWAVTIIAIAAVFALSVYYANNTVSNGYICRAITEYSSVEDIPEEIALLEKSIENEDDEGEIAYYEQVILIYNYLYENQISYEELTENYATAFMRWYLSDDAVSYVDLYMAENCSYVICAAMIICAAVLISSDFGGNMYKTVFGTNKSRAAILRGRFFAYLIYFAALFVVTMFIIAVTSSQYGLPFKYIICSMSGSVFVISPVAYIIITFALWAVFLLGYVAAIFGISACFKNIFAALAFPAAYYGGVVALSGAYYSDVALLSKVGSVFGEKIYTLNDVSYGLLSGTYSPWCYITAFIVKLIFAAIFIAIGTAVYKKRQL